MKSTWKIRGLIIFFLAIILGIEGRYVSDEEESEESPQRSPHHHPQHHKSLGTPTLLFGNPEVLPSSRDEIRGYKFKGSRSNRKISLRTYERATNELEHLNNDEAIFRKIIIERFKRSPDRLTDEEYDEEEQWEAEEEEEEETDEEEKQKEMAKNANSTTTSMPKRKRQISPESIKPSSSTPKSAPTSKTSTASPSKNSSSQPPNNSSMPKLSSNSTQGQKPPTGQGVQKPPGPPGQRPLGPGGKPLGRPPFGFPPHLLFANRTKRPARKGELYLPDDYNNLEIPKLDAGKLFGIKGVKLSPVPVLVFLNIRSVRDIDELNEEIVLDMDMKVEWVDGILFDPINALSRKPMKPTTLNPVFLRKIWQPDIYVDETVRVIRTSLMAKPQTLLFSAGTGLVSYTFRTAVRMQCEMNFHYYPSDTHFCKFHVRSYSYFDADLDLGWLRQGAFLQDPGDPNFDLRISAVEEIKIDQVFNENNNDTYDGLAFTVVARRKLSYHMAQTYLPTVFFIVITWLCFLVPARMVEARIGISMTTLLTLTAMFSSVRESTPIVSYIKAIDVWMIFNVFFVFLTLLEFSLLVWIRSFREDAEEKKLEHEREMQARRGMKNSDGRDLSPARSSVQLKLKKYEKLAEFVEKFAFLIFCLMFIVFNIIYWTWLLTASDYFNWNVNASWNGGLDDD